MRTLKLTQSQAENLADFIECYFILSIREDENIDNIGYLVEICDVYKQLKEGEQK